MMCHAHRSRTASTSRRLMAWWQWATSDHWPRARWRVRALRVTAMLGTTVGLLPLGAQVPTPPDSSNAARSAAAAHASQLTTGHARGAAADSIATNAIPASATSSASDSAARDRDQPDRPTPGIDPVSAAAREYAESGIARTVREGASVTYPYGHSQPTVTCAPLRACVIELEAGEVVLSKIAGDTQRWQIEPASAGADGRTPLIVVKPHDCGLTTNLVLSTTRGRIYDLTLDSPPCARGLMSERREPPNPDEPYTRHVRFYYPDDLVESWTRPPEPAKSAESPSPVIPAAVETFNFSYHTSKDKAFPWTPLAVFDDGAHCYIKLPPSAAHAAAPVLFLVAPDGSKTLLNYTLSGDTYITDRVFRQAVLVLGEGTHQSELHLENAGLPSGAP